MLINWLPILGFNHKTRRQERRPKSIVSGTPLVQIEQFEDRLLLTAQMLDADFGNRGLATTDFSPLNGPRDIAHDIERTSTGQYYVAGSAVGGTFFTLGTPVGVLARYNADGTLDTTFGAGGSVSSQLFNVIDPNSGVPIGFHDVVVLSDGSLLVAGGITSAIGTPTVGVMKLTATGVIDTTFGVNGMFNFNINANQTTSWANAMVVQNDGKIVLVGDTVNVNNITNGFVARLDSNGSIDNTFAGGGFGFIINPNRGGTNVERVTDVALDNQQRIVIAGSSASPTDVDFMLIRLNSVNAFDPNFGTGGFVFTDFGAGGIDQAHDVVIQSDGSIVLGGFTTRNGDQDFALARYDGTGNLLNGFGTQGLQVSALGSTNEIINGLALDTSGNIIATGFSQDVAPGESPVFDMLVARYNGVTGVRDNSLNPGNAGIVPVRFNGSLSNAGNAVLVEPNGNITVAGQTSNANFVENFALTRLTSTGGFDNSFGAGGKVVTDFSQWAGATEFVRGSLTQPDGKIVVYGGSNGTPIGFVARYNANGSLDATFGEGGLLAVMPFTLFDPNTFQPFGVSDVALLSDGSMLLAGTVTTVFNGPDQEFGVLKITANGTIETTFGINGLAAANNRVGSNQRETATSIVVMNDGKIIVSGHTDNFNSSDLNSMTASFLSNGQLNTNFGINGIAEIGGPGDDTVNDILVDSQQRLLLVGTFRGTAGSPPGDFLISRISSTTGQFDPTFNTGAPLIVNIGGDDIATSAVLLAGDQVVIGGSTTVNGTRDFALTRLANNGSFVNGFGNQGIAIFNLPNSNELLLGMQSDGSGNAIAVGSAVQTNSSNPLQQFAVGRFNLTSGAIDTSLDPASGGLKRFGFFADTVGSASSVSFQGTNLVVTGTTGDGVFFTGNNNLALARLTSAGAFDTTFGVGGRVVTDITNVNGSLDIANSIITLPNGKYVVAGGSGAAFGRSLQGVVTRYNADGSLDTTFGTNGRFGSGLFDIVDPQTGAPSGFTDVVALADGSLLLTGSLTRGNTVNPTGDGRFGVLKLTPTGQIDTTFGDRGLAVFDNIQNAGGFSEVPYSILTRANGNIVLAGALQFSGAPNDFDVSVVEFDANGVFQSIFNVDLN